MEPISGALAGKAVDSLFRILGKLGERDRAERLVERIVLKKDKGLPALHRAERRRLERLFAAPGTWSLLAETSVRVSRELIGQVEACLAGEHDQTTRHKLAVDIAELAVSELPASLDIDDQVVLASYQNRLLADQLREIRELASEKRHSPVAPPPSADAAEYRRQLELAITRRRPKIQFALTFRDSESSDKPIDHLPETVAANRQVAIHAKAGAGKSAALVDLALRLNSNEQNAVVFVDLKPWAHERSRHGGPNDEEVTVNQILSASVVPANSQLIQDIHASLPSANSKQYWLVDGINELPSELSRQVLEALTTHLRGIVRSSLVVTDRSATRYADDLWSVVQINPLESSEVDRLLPPSPAEEVETSKAVSKTGGSEDSGRRKLLATPFFLDVALTDRRWTWKSSVQAIHGMFAERLRLTERDIDELADFALSMYTRKEGLTFSLDELVKAVGSTIARGLIESEILLFPDEDSAAFYHQLLHDYLASRSLAARPDAWTPKYFDALSFDANAYESLIMVLEQINTDERLSEYITALYDWNWFGTIRCVERSLRDGEALPSHLVIALSAMLGEKRFDPVMGSRVRADEWTTRLDEVTGFHFKEAASVAALVEEVERISDGSGPAWFRAWRALFTLLGDPTHSPTEAEISEISNPDPLIGWTATQVARHCNIGQEGTLQIRSIYRGARHASDDQSCSIRWRAVHALGCHPSSENARLLLDAIDNDRYSWVVYGAIRSILEMAALSEDEATERFLSQVDARLSMLPAGPLSQVAWATQYEGASPGWAERVWPLLQHAYDLQETDEGKELWRLRLEAFKTWSERERS